MDKDIIMAVDANVSTANIISGRTEQGLLSEESHFMINCIMRLIKKAIANGEFSAFVPRTYLSLSAVKDSIHLYGYEIEEDQVNDGYWVSWKNPKHQ